MSILDLDAAIAEHKAKQAEAGRAPDRKTVTFKGREWDLPATPPMSFVALYRRFEKLTVEERNNLDEQVIYDIMIALLGSDVWDEWLDLRIEIEHVGLFLARALELYRDVIVGDESEDVADPADIKSS